MSLIAISPLPKWTTWIGAQLLPDSLSPGECYLESTLGQWMER